MRGSELFSDREFYQVKENQIEALKRRAKDLSQDELVEAKRRILAAALVEEFELKVPTILEAEISAQDVEGEVRLSRQESYLRNLREGSALKATIAEILVPFEGDAKMFSITPSQYGFNRPFAEIRCGSLVFQYPMKGQTPQQTRAAFDADLANLKSYVGNLERDCMQFNGELVGIVETAITNRAALLESKDQFMGGLGFPRS